MELHALSLVVVFVPRTGQVLSITEDRNIELQPLRL